ncbi:DNA cross-link repair 1A protein [Orchesella cincta]|uniref:DNA cross-link repair 1A protein n=1 Tax=Orchesella cincta TaxID=48709 RepID=A0A1D2MF33_ORCCI|nr:DNA cross-link repair 1A protein [Orchesella cincta]
MQKNQKEALQDSNVKVSFKRGLKQSSKPKGSTSKKAVQSPSRKILVWETAVIPKRFQFQAVIGKFSEALKPQVLKEPIVPKSSKNLAPIFLPASERKALQSSKAGKVKSESELLSSIIESNSQIEDASKDNPKHFNGNVVILNQDQPLTDPYEGTKTKVCPFYKKLPGVPFCVDAFNYGLIPGMEVYFLSHYHSDHYIGLSKKFCKTLVCSRPTGNLVRMKSYVEEKCIRKLCMNKPYIICGSEITLIDANHNVYFPSENWTSYFAYGDFRYTPDMLQNPYLDGLRIDSLYLDTTYCSPQYDFPTQSESISVVVSYIKRQLEYRPKTLILCGSYLIGKERVYFTLAEAIGSKVFGNYDKRKILNALENPKFSSLLASDENNAKIHVVPMFSISAKNLQEYLDKRPQFSNIIGIKPSGWQFSSAGSGCSVKTHYGDTVTVVGVPYSEHSSFSELREFVTSLKPKKVQPTVNVGNAKKRGEMTMHIESWLKT